MFLWARKMLRRQEKLATRLRRAFGQGTENAEEEEGIG